MQYRERVFTRLTEFVQDMECVCETERVDVRQRESVCVYVRERERVRVSACKTERACVR